MLGFSSLETFSFGFLKLHSNFRVYSHHGSLSYDVILLFYYRICNHNVHILSGCLHFSYESPFSLCCGIFGHSFYRRHVYPTSFQNILSVYDIFLASNLNEQILCVCLNCKLYRISFDIPCNFWVHYFHHHLPNEFPNLLCYGNFDYISHIGMAFSTLFWRFLEIFHQYLEYLENIMVDLWCHGIPEKVFLKGVSYLLDTYKDCI
jgi:hypothetical protein